LLSSELKYKIIPFLNGKAYCIPLIKADVYFLANKRIAAAQNKKARHKKRAEIE
jgi:hypothetical protein